MQWLTRQVSQGMTSLGGLGSGFGLLLLLSGGAVGSFFVFLFVLLMNY